MPRAVLLELVQAKPSQGGLRLLRHVAAEDNRGLPLAVSLISHTHANTEVEHNAPGYTVAAAWPACPGGGGLSASPSREEGGWPA